jgi:WD40 repeat protein
VSNNANQQASTAIAKRNDPMATQVNPSNVAVQPRFFFGVKGDVKNNVLFLDDNVVAYPCGHNVVVYYISEKMQRFIPGIEGSQGITALALSASRKFLAVCEKGTNAICTVYNIGKFLEYSVEKRTTSIFDVPLKKRKILCSAEDPAREFVSVDFCARNEKLLVTASGGADARVIIWNWDKQRCMSFCELGPRGKSTVS